MLARGLNGFDAASAAVAVDVVVARGGGVGAVMVRSATASVAGGVGVVVASGVGVVAARVAGWEGCEVWVDGGGGDGLLGAPFEMVVVVVVVVGMVLGEGPCSAGFVDGLSSVGGGLT